MATTAVSNNFVMRLIGASALDAAVYEEIEADQGATGRNRGSSQPLIHAVRIMERAVVPPAVLRGVGKLISKVERAKHLSVPVTDPLQRTFF